MTTKTFRAVEVGYHDGILLQVGATFAVDVDRYKDEHDGDEFAPNWAVEVDDGHQTTVGDVGTQEQQNLDPAPALPTIADPAQPLAPFHPTVAQQLAVEQANAENGDKSVEVKTTAQILADQAASSETAPDPAPRRSRRKPGSNAIDTGTEPSDAQKAEATEASKAEVDAKAEDEGHDFT